MRNKGWIALVALILTIGLIIPSNLAFSAGEDLWQEESTLAEEEGKAALSLEGELEEETKEQEEEVIFIETAQEETFTEEMMTEQSEVFLSEEKEIDLVWEVFFSEENTNKEIEEIEEEKENFFSAEAEEETSSSEEEVRAINFTQVAPLQAPVVGGSN